MDSGVRTTSSVEVGGGARERVAAWLFLEGDRRAVAAAIALLVVVGFGGLVAGGVLAVGPSSSVAGVFGSGLTAGVVTLLTIALSINQLILSRVFGSPNQLVDRLDGARDLRARVEDLAGEPSSPNDPAAFLSLLAATLSDRATAALRATGRSEGEPPPAVTAAMEDIAAYGRSLDGTVEPEEPVADVLGAITGTEYAMNMAAVGHLRSEHGAALSGDTRAELRAVEELLESVAVVRQFFKTIALQQDFATLSRLLVYSGLVALLASVSLTLVYRTGSVTLPPPTLRVVVPLAFGVVVTPLALFAAYILRAATVAHRTVSVGPFVPPSER